MGLPDLERLRHRGRIEDHRPLLEDHGTVLSLQREFGAGEAVTVLLDEGREFRIGKIAVPGRVELEDADEVRLLRNAHGDGVLLAEAPEAARHVISAHVDDLGTVGRDRRCPLTARDLVDEVLVDSAVLTPRAALRPPGVIGEMPDGLLNRKVPVHIAFIIVAVPVRIVRTPAVRVLVEDVKELTHREVRLSGIQRT